jgi:outer membrane protein, multidrug efflux system
MTRGPRISDALRRALALSGIAALCGCSVGPDYQRPLNSVIDRPSTNSNFVEGARPVFAQDELSGDWWRLYRDPTLDTLIEQALAANTDLRVAAASIARAEAGADIAKAAQFPTTTLEANPTFTRLSPQEELLPNVNIPPQGLYSLGGGLSYQIDLFGQIRRAIESAKADVVAAHEAYDVTRITVVAETAKAYADVCSAGRQIAIAKRSVALQAQSTQLTRELFETGRGISLDVTRAKALEDRVRASIPPLEASQRVALYRLTVLTGRPPEEFPVGVARCADEPRLSQPVPIGDGAALVARRPDIRRAEAIFHATTAQVGVAIADLYPKVTFGLSAASVGPNVAFLQYSTLKYSAGPLITWEFPNRLVAEAHIRGAKADVEVAFAQFDGAVLAALREVEGALVVYARDLDQRKLLAASRDQSAIAAADAEKLFKAGSTNYLTALDANLALITADQSLAMLDGKIVDDQIMLFLALGGGWESPRLLPHKPIVTPPSQTANRL